MCFVEDIGDSLTLQREENWRDTITLQFHNTPVKLVKDDDCDGKPDLILPRKRSTKDKEGKKNLPTYVGIDVTFTFESPPPSLKNP